MNETCAKCGAKCCKVAFFPCEGAHKDFILKTRQSVSVPMGVLVPSQCHYLGADNKCVIYDVRFKPCQDWEVNGFGCQMVRRAAGEGILITSDEKARG